MVAGSCLCGEVAFEVGEPLTQIELCHCEKCRKAYGAPFCATLYSKRAAFRWTRGESRVATFDAPLEDSPPAYRHSFCNRCGSPLPLVWEGFPFVEIPVAMLDEEVLSNPAYQMFECQCLEWIRSISDVPWHERGAPREEKVLMSLL